MSTRHGHRCRGHRGVGLASHDADLERLLVQLRVVLRPEARCCAHCGGNRVQRWGHFSGRQRYRCLSCGRTFSDFTGTALSYLKRLDRWAVFCRRLHLAESVRRTAARIDVHRNTVFRWRHLALSSMLASEGWRLSGMVDLGWMALPFSQKGSRHLDRAARRRLDFWWFIKKRAWVLLACDSCGRGYGCHVTSRQLATADIARLLSPRLHPEAVVTSRMDHPAVVAAIAHRAGVSCGEPGPSANWCAPGPPISDARQHGIRIRFWLARFRGVATRYLDHYLCWHRICGRLAATGGPARADPGALAAATAGRFPPDRESADPLPAHG